MQPELIALAARCGQAGEADHLQHFLSTPEALRKTPCLLLGHEHRSGRREPELCWAAMLFEYRVPMTAGLGSARLYATGDSTGRRNILAEPERRAEAAALAARKLLERGAQMVHLAFSQSYTDCDTDVTGSMEGAAALAIASTLRAEQSSARARLSGRALWTLHEHSVPLYLPLLPTLDATLARVHTKTRFNLRYYRRRAEQQLSAEYVPAVQLSEEAFLAFNRRCTYAVPDALARHRFRAVEQRGGRSRSTFFAGVRDGEGEWLSLVGGRRMNGFAEIDWQMNRADLPSYSLSTVLRSFLIEDEIARGTTRLFIEGGTPHPIANSFVQEHVGELTIKRRSAYMAAIERLGQRFFPRENYLGQILRSRELHWREC